MTQVEGNKSPLPLQELMCLVCLQNFPKNKHFLPLIRTRACPFQGERNINFSKNFTNVLKERSLKQDLLKINRSWSNSL